MRFGAPSRIAREYAETLWFSEDPIVGTVAEKANTLKRSLRLTSGCCGYMAALIAKAGRISPTGWRPLVAVR